MKTMREQWTSYAERVLPKPAGTNQVIETQRAFYAGAWAMYQLVLELSGDPDDVSEQSLAAGAANLIAIEAELRAFAEAVKDQPQRTPEGYPICTPERPWRESDGVPALHPDAIEEGEQESGWPAGDVVPMRCPHCGVRWKKELPQ